jgi:Cys-rich protein (TIGR01571 family)
MKIHNQIRFQSQMTTLMFQDDDYNTGLCDCFDDCTVFLEGWLCGYCQVSAQYNMLFQNKPGVDICVCGVLLCADAWCTLGLALASFTAFTRLKVKGTFQLVKESGLCSCAKGFFCASCSNCQTYREMSLRNRWPGGVCVDAPYRKEGLCAPQAVSMDSLYNPAGPSHGPPPPPACDDSYAYGEPFKPQQGNGGYGQPPPPSGYGSYGQPQYAQPQQHHEANGASSPYGTAQYTSNPGPPVVDAVPAV